MVRDTIRKATGAPSVLSASPAPEQSAYYPNRLLVELIAPHSMGDVHIHYRDYRLQLTRSELRTLSAALRQAVNTLARFEEQFPERLKEPRRPEDIARRCDAGKSPTPGPGHFRAMLRDRDI